MTQENSPPSHLYYLIKGEAISSKQGRKFTISEGHFVGEISFILGGNATASVKLDKGNQYLSWEKAQLYALLDKKPELRRMFEAHIARDMAKKLAIS